MLTFLDGPAAGLSLLCARAPLLIRVVRSPSGRFDALDQVGDAPEFGERIFVYVKAQDREQYPHRLHRGRAAAQPLGAGCVLPAL